MNKKAVYSFLTITFGLTLSLIIAAKLRGFTLIGKPLLSSQLTILAAMFVPAIAAIFTQKYVLKKPLKALGLKIGPKSYYLKTYLVIISVFILKYAITWLFILKPDFTLNAFLDQFMIDTALPMSAGQLVLIFAFTTFIIAPIFNMIPSLGEEIGWRGFLLPNIENLGKTKSAIISGMIWALWHTPMILLLGFLYGEHIWLGAILHFLLVTSLGIWMAFIWFKTKSTILSGFIHSVFNANAYGIWSMIFISENKLLVGAGGIVNVAIWFIIGSFALYKIKALE